MATTLQATIQPQLKVVETISGVATSGVDNAEYNHDLVSNTVLNTATGNPKAEEVWTGRITLSGGTASLDLTALTYLDERKDVDLTGKKVLAVKAVSVSGNSAAIEIEGHGTNPYELFGDVDTKVDVGVGEFVVKGIQEGNNAVLAAVSSTVKQLLFTGSGTDKVDLTIVAGT